ncbi:MAG: hypothetical protein WCO29_11760 [Nostocales cyanobacterium ELA583]|jgi:hypothetical protein
MIEIIGRACCFGLGIYVFLVGVDMKQTNQSAFLSTMVCACGVGCMSVAIKP